MDAKESKEMEILCKKPHKTEKEIEQYKKLLEKFFDETLYFGEHED